MVRKTTEVDQRRAPSVRKRKPTTTPPPKKRRAREGAPSNAPLCRQRRALQSPQRRWRACPDAHYLLTAMRPTKEGKYLSVLRRHITCSSPPSPPPPHTPAQENSNCCKADHPCSSSPAHKLIAAQPPADRTPSNGQMRQGRGQGHTAARATPTNARAIAVQQRAKEDDLEAAHRGEPLQAQSGRGRQRHEQPSRTPSVATRGGPAAAQILMPLVSFHDEGFDGQVSQPLHAGTEMRHPSPKGKKNELWRGAEQVSPSRCLLFNEPGGSNEAKAPRDGDRGRGAE